MRRGEIWTVAGAGHIGKPRPALIIQADAFDATSSVTVIPFTSAGREGLLTRVLVPATDVTGIGRDSFAEVDKLTTTKRASVGTLVGRAPASTMRQIERSLMVFLGLAS